MAGLDWAAVGIAWLLSTVTTFIILGIGWLIVRKKRKKKQAIKRSPSSESSMPMILSKETGHGSLRSDASAMTNSTRISVERPGYQRVSSREDPGPPRGRRQTNIHVSRWCDERGLPEAVAAALIDHGFNTRQYLDSLSWEDVPNIGGLTVAQQCMLRNNLHKRDEDQPRRGSGNLAPPGNKGSRQRLKSGTGRHRSTSTEEGGSSTATTPLQSSFPANGLDDRSRSATQLAAEDEVDYGGSGSANNSRYHNSIDEEDVNSGPRSPQHNGRNWPQRRPAGPGKGISIVSSNSHYAHSTSRTDFNGLLSDEGLHELAKSIGANWELLASYLKLTKPDRERIKLDYPGNAEMQIYEMLRTWRDSTKTRKAEVKGELVRALEHCSYMELAEELLREEVAGSREYVPGQHSGVNYSGTSIGVNSVV